MKMQPKKRVRNKRPKVQARKIKRDGYYIVGGDYINI